jgi:hypothetical protein
MSHSNDSTNPSFWPTHRPRLRSAEGWDRKIKVKKRLRPEENKETEKVYIRKIER